MMGDNGRAPSGQALAVPVEPVSRLDPSGFDPSRGFVEWEHEPDEFDRDIDAYFDGVDDDPFDDCSMMPDGSCGQAGSEYCEFDCPMRRRFS